MTPEAETWDERVERVMQGGTKMIVPNIVDHDCVMFCSKCNAAVAVAKGEFTTAYHDCEPDAEMSTLGCDFPGCDQDAVRWVALGQERQGYPAAVETWITVEEARCAKHCR